MTAKVNYMTLTYGDTYHSWMTGNDYQFDIKDGNIVFGSEAGTEFEIPLSVAKTLGGHFEEVFGVKINYDNGTYETFEEYEVV